MADAGGPGTRGRRAGAQAEPLAGVEAPPTPAELARTLDRLRGEADALRGRGVRELQALLGRVGARFLDEDDPLRSQALAELPDSAGISPAMAREILDGMARDWTEERLSEMLTRDLGEPTVLDALVGGRMAVGPGLCLQVVSGSVPGVAVHALLRSVLVKAPTLLKPGVGDTLLPGLFRRGLAEEDPSLAAALAVVYWPGGSTELERVALAAAEVAVVYGSDETVGSLRALAPATTRFVGYHHRVGLGIVGRDVRSVERTAAEVARAAVMFEQRGCVCPQLLYVEEGGAVDPDRFAEILGDALADVETWFPAPEAGLDRSALQQLRGTAEIQAGMGPLEVHHGGAEATWTVIYEPEPLVGSFRAPRTLRVRPVPDVSELPEFLAPFERHLQSVGYAGLGSRATSTAEALGRAGASRITPFRGLAFPPPWWLHDGQGPIRALVRWVELER
ncbi:MAG: acyl-CoA reductase [Longimicrobiales bacterium]|nr:acyl-CoA reductase [Longimicrobiales bacterium]